MAARSPSCRKPCHNHYLRRATSPPRYLAASSDGGELWNRGQLALKSKSGRSGSLLLLFRLLRHHHDLDFRRDLVAQAQLDLVQAAFLDQAGELDHVRLDLQVLALERSRDLGR